MYYYGYFRSTDTSIDAEGQLYKVVIITNYNEDETTEGGELTLCETPFTVEYKGEESNVFKPYKCSTATVRFLLEDYNPQFNNTSGNNVLVSLLKYKNNGDTDDNGNYTIDWIGFATPNAYNQSYEYAVEEFELECQDAFSTLRYYDFEKIEYNEIIDNKYVSFSDILKYWVKFLGTYNHIYITDSVKVPTEDFQDVLHACYINEDNFFDEDGEPMKAIEVIEEILNYLGLTLIPWGDSIYVINYNGLINGWNDYFIYEGDNLTLSGSKAHTEHFKDIIGDDISEGGQTISVDSVYKRVKVSDDFYPLEDLIVQTKDYEDWIDSDYFDNEGRYTEKVNIVQSNDDITEIDTTVYNNQKVFIKYVGVDNSVMGTYWYNRNDMSPDWTIDQDRHWTYDITRKKVGAVNIKYQVSEVDSFEDTINSVELKDALLITNGDGGNYNDKPRDSQAYNNPTYKVASWITKSTAVGNDNYLVISGKFTFYHYGELLPINEDYDNNKKMDSKLNFQWAMLNTNDGLYWNGTEWWETPCFFKLPLKYEETKEAFGKEIPIINNINWSDKLDKEGYAIPMPHRDKTQEARIYQFNFSLAQIFGVCKDRITRSALLTDFNIEVATKSYMNQISSADDSDTEYTNTINGKGIEEYDDIEFKITTWDGKEVNHSSVIYNEYFLENGYLVGTFEDDEKVRTLRRLENIYNVGNGMILRPEEMKIYDIVQQYKTPTLILEMNLRNDIKPWSVLTYNCFEDKLFVVDEISIDYQYNQTNVKLVEKK